MVFHKSHDYEAFPSLLRCMADKGDLARPAKFGEDHILMVTDYCYFDSPYSHWVSGMLPGTEIPERQKEKIIGENAARLLKL